MWAPAAKKRGRLIAMLRQFARQVFPLLCVALVAGTLCHYWYVMQTHMLDAPQGDDFVDILWFFEIFLSRERWQEKLDALFFANHEHITLLNHLLYLLHYRLVGIVNVTHYVWIGHVFVLASCAVLARWLASKTDVLLAITLAIVCYLNLFFWDSSFWPMTAISNQAVILFALLAAWSYQKNPQNILPPLGWALAATASQFNGLCVFLALLLAMFFESWQTGKNLDRRQCLLVLLAMVVTSTAYALRENPFSVAEHLNRFILYTEPEQIADFHPPSFTLPPPATLARDLALRVPASVIGAFGATIWAQDQLLPAVITGVILLGLFGYSLRRNGTIDRFSLLLFFFCLASLLLIALGRSLFFGAENCLLSRYRMYGFLMLLMAGNGFLQGRTRQASIIILLFAGVLTQFASRQILPALEKNRDDVAMTYYYWLIDGGMGRERMVFYPHNRDVRLLHAYQRGYYNPMHAIDARHQPLSVTQATPVQCPADSTATNTGTVTAPALKAWSKKPSAIAVEITLTNTDVPADKQTELWFCNDTAAYRVLLSAAQYNPDSGNYWPQLLLKKQLPPAQYRSYLHIAGEWRPSGVVSFR